MPAVTCPSDCDVTQYDARLSYAPLSATLLATLSSQQRQQLETAYRKSLDIAHRIDADLMTTHVRHFRQLSSALRHLQTSYDVNIKTSGTKSLNDGLNNIVAVVGGDIRVLFGMLANYQAAYDHVMAATRDVLMTSLARQRSSVQQLLQAPWRLADDDVASKRALLGELTSATRDVINVLSHVNYVSVGSVGDFDRYVGRAAVVVQRNNSRCEQTNQRWIDSANRMKLFTHQLSYAIANNSHADWLENLNDIQRFWRSEESTYDQLTSCIVAFPTMLQKVVALESRQTEANYLRASTSTFTSSNIVEMYERLRRLPLLAHSLGDRFSNNSVGIAALLRIVLDETQNRVIADSLRTLQNEVVLLMEPFRRRLADAQSAMATDYVEAFQLFGEAARYTGSSVMTAITELNIWRRPRPVGRTNALRYESGRGGYWPAYRLRDFVERAANAKASGALHDYFAVLETSINALTDELVRSTNRVAQILQRYRDFFRTNVTHADINQHFVRQVYVNSFLFFYFLLIFFFKYFCVQN